MDKREETIWAFIDLCEAVANDAKRGLTHAALRGLEKRLALVARDVEQVRLAVAEQIKVAY